MMSGRLAEGSAELDVPTLSIGAATPTQSPLAPPPDDERERSQSPSISHVDPLELLESAAEKLRRGLRSVRVDLNQTGSEDLEENDGGEGETAALTSPNAADDSRPKGIVGQRRRSPGLNSLASRTNETADELQSALGTLEEALEVIKKAKERALARRKKKPSIDDSISSVDDSEGEEAITIDTSNLFIKPDPADDPGKSPKAGPKRSFLGLSATSKVNANDDHRLFDDVEDDDVATWLVENYADEHKRETTGFDVKLQRSSSIMSPAMLMQHRGSVAEPSSPMLTAQTAAEEEKGIMPTGQTTKYERSASRSYPAFCSVRRYKESLSKVNVKEIPDINNPDFDIFQLLADRGEERVFLDVAMNVFLQYNFVQSLQFDLKRFHNFLTTLKSLYRSENPYHNSIHAADVLQTTHVYMCVGDVKQNFSDVELLAVLFAAMVHDAGHLGVNNHFLTKAGHTLAMIYNDNSPLESAHISIAFHLMSTPSTNFFYNSYQWTKERHADFRLLVIETIMGTDMKHHSDLTGMVRDILEDGKIEDNEVGRLFKGIVHAADMSNPMKPLHIYKQWIHRVIAEFWQQGDEERRRGVPISIMCDRETAKIAKQQVGFIDFVVKPYMTELSPVLPPIWIERLTNNRKAMESAEDDLDMQQGIERFASVPWKEIPVWHPNSIVTWIMMAAEPKGREKALVLGPSLRPDEISFLVSSCMTCVGESTKQGSSLKSAASRDALIGTLSSTWVRALGAVIKGRVPRYDEDFDLDKASPSPAGTALGHFMDAIAVESEAVPSSSISDDSHLDLTQMSVPQCVKIARYVAERGAQVLTVFKEQHKNIRELPEGSIGAPSSRRWTIMDLTLTSVLSGMNTPTDEMASVSQFPTLSQDRRPSDSGAITFAQSTANPEQADIIRDGNDTSARLELYTVECAVQLTRMWYQVTQTSGSFSSASPALPGFLNTGANIGDGSFPSSQHSSVRTEQLVTSGRLQPIEISSPTAPNAQSKSEPLNTSVEKPTSPTRKSGGSKAKGEGSPKKGKKKPLLQSLLKPLPQANARGASANGILPPDATSTASSIPTMQQNNNVSLSATGAAVGFLTNAYVGRTRRLDEIPSAARWERRLVIDSAATNTPGTNGPHGALKPPTLPPRSRSTPPDFPAQ